MHDGHQFHKRTVIDESTREYVVARWLRSDDVPHALAELFVAHGPPEHIRSDNGPEFAGRMLDRRVHLNGAEVAAPVPVTTHPRASHDPRKRLG